MLEFVTGTWDVALIPLMTTRLFCTRGEQNLAKTCDIKMPY